MVLETTFHTTLGVARVIDIMPIDTHYSGVVRIVESLSADVSFLMNLVMRFD